MDLQPMLLQGKAIQSALERQFISQYLKDQGIEWAAIRSIPNDQARMLMAKASQYASLKLAEIEARSKFIQKIA